MIHRFGNLVEEVTSGIIVHQVNAQGVMGSGIAKDIKEKYPRVFDDYAKELGPAYSQRNSGIDFMGRIIWTRYPHRDIGVDQTGVLWIASLVGQQFFGREKKRYTSYDALDVGFAQIGYIAKYYEMPVHVPYIGCGLGGGDWSIVSAIIEKNLDKIDFTLWEKT